MLRAWDFEVRPKISLSNWVNVYRADDILDTSLHEEKTYSRDSARTPPKKNDILRRSSGSWPRSRLCIRFIPSLDFPYSALQRLSVDLPSRRTRLARGIGFMPEYCISFRSKMTRKGIREEYPMLRIPFVLLYLRIVALIPCPPGLLSVMGPETLTLEWLLMHAVIFHWLPHSHLDSLISELWLFVERSPRIRMQSGARALKQVVASQTNLRNMTVSVSRSTEMNNIISPIQPLLHLPLFLIPTFSSRIIISCRFSQFLVHYSL